MTERKGQITIVFQIVGASTLKMAELKAGDSFRDFTGPLGCPSEFVNEDLEALKNKRCFLLPEALAPHRYIHR